MTPSGQEERGAYKGLKIVTFTAAGLFLFAVLVLPALNVVSVPMIAVTGAFLALCAALIGVLVWRDDRAAQKQFETANPEVAASMARYHKVQALGRLAKTAVGSFPLILIVWFLFPGQFGAGWVIVSLIGTAALLAHTVAPGSERFVGTLTLCTGLFWASVSGVLYSSGINLAELKLSLGQFSSGRFRPEPIVLICSLVYAAECVRGGVWALLLKTEPPAG